MNEHSIVLIVCLAVIVVLAALLYAAGRSYISAHTDLRDIHSSLTMILAHTQNTDLELNRHRRVLYDAHKRICAVTKGVVKPSRLNPTKS